MDIVSLDHLVLTVTDIPRSLAFYQTVLGMQAVAFTPSPGEQRWALHFGSSKINLHLVGKGFKPNAQRATPGSADLCFLSAKPILEVVARLKQLKIEILEGPVKRTGAAGPICSVYFRDPDGNLIEVANSWSDNPEPYPS